MCIICILFVGLGMSAVPDTGGIRVTAGGAGSWEAPQCVLRAKHVSTTRAVRAVGTEPSLPQPVCFPLSSVSFTCMFCKLRPKSGLESEGLSVLITGQLPPQTFYSMRRPWRIILVLEEQGEACQASEMWLERLGRTSLVFLLVLFIFRF